MFDRAAWLGLVLVVGCGGGEPEPPRPALPEVPTLTGAHPRRGAPAGPAEAPKRCEGHSVDPPAAAVDAALALVRAQRVEEGYAKLLELTISFPRSATTRVRAATVAVQDTPPHTVDAQRLYEEALRLHDEGCALEDRELWFTLQGLSLSHLLEDRDEAARPLLERSLARWPSASATRYNLACTLCRAGELDGCVRQLEATLEGVQRGEEPPFLSDQPRRGLEDYLGLLRTDPDLAPLRDDPRFAALLVRYTAPSLSPEGSP